MKSKRTSAWCFNGGFTFVAMAVVLILAGCGGSDTAKEDAQGSVEVVDEKPDIKLSRIERELLAIDKLTDEGEVDKSAAALVRMRMKGAQFTSDEAAAYRDSLSIAYDKALELVAEENSKGKVAMKILQSNGAF